MTKLKEIEGWVEKKEKSKICGVSDEICDDSMCDDSVEDCPEVKLGYSIFDKCHDKAIDKCGELEIDVDEEEVKKLVKTFNGWFSRDFIIAVYIAKNIGKVIKLKEPGK